MTNLNNYNIAIEEIYKAQIIAENYGNKNSIIIHLKSAIKYLEEIE